MTKTTEEQTATAIATKLATDTANTAVALATTAAKTASDLATKTAETTTEIRTNIEWMKNSLLAIEAKLNEMDKAFVTAAQHQIVVSELDDHEKRVRALETRTLVWVGGLAVLTFLVPILIKVLNIF